MSKGGSVGKEEEMDAKELEGESGKKEDQIKKDTTKEGRERGGGRG